MCAELFHYGADLDYEFTLLDIGGGFPGTDKMELFQQEAAIIQQTLAKSFNARLFPKLKIIAEPGDGYYYNKTPQYTHESLKSLHCWPCMQSLAT